MSSEKPVKLRVKTTPQRRQLGWRAMGTAGALWAAAMVIQPMGIAKGLKFATIHSRFLLSYGLSVISLAAILVAVVILKPWRRRGTRSRAILMLSVAMALGDLYLLSWFWRQ